MEQTAFSLLQEALACYQRGEAQRAEELTREALRREPNNADGWHLLGMLALQVKRLDVAEQLLRRACALNSAHAEIRRHLGDALVLQGRHAEAAGAYSEALRQNPQDHAARAMLAGTLHQMGRSAEAIPEFQRAIQHFPNSAEVRCDYGVSLARVNRNEEAISAFRQAIKLNPDLPAAWLNLCDIFRRVGRQQEAADAGKRAVELLPNESSSHTAYANALQVNGDFEEANAEYELAIKLEPKNPDAWNNRGLTLLKLCRIDDAMNSFNRAMELVPNWTDARANRSLAYLLNGDLETGLVEYETRWQSGGFTTRPSNYRQPFWDGSDLTGKSILLHSEQGFGDTIQFARYGTLAKERGARKVILSCAAPLTDLLRTIDGVDEVTETGKPPHNGFDVHLPMASLPLVFKTSLQTIPAKVPYVKPDKVRVEQWREKLSNFEGLKVGIVWAGSPHHLNDRARSVKLADFAPLARIPGVTFFSLQKGEQSKQAANPPAGMKLIDFTSEIRDFMDSAALVQNLDLVFSVDTSVVHLAGALAKPVWVLLTFGPDWRWLLWREDTPWYPTMRLFRQPRPKAWTEAIEYAARELEKLVTSKSK